MEKPVNPPQVGRKASRRLAKLEQLKKKRRLKIVIWIAVITTLIAAAIATGHPSLRIIFMRPSLVLWALCQTRHGEKTKISLLHCRRIVVKFPIRIQVKSFVWMCRGYNMQDKIHPEYKDSKVTCACGNSFTTRSTRGSLAVDICAKCHPFYTGKQKLIDAAGRVEKFQRKFGGDYFKKGEKSELAKKK